MEDLTPLIRPSPKPDLVPRDPAYAERVRASFARQTFMDTIGARMTAVAPGSIDLRLEHAATLLQQHGYMHAGALVAAVDSAAGYAAMTLVAPSAGIVTADMKLNVLNPARSGPYLAEGRVVKSGRRLIVCRGDVFAGDELAVHVLTGLFTMIQVEGRDE